MTFVGESESIFFGNLKQSNLNSIEKDDGDALTVATSAINQLSVFSNANSSQFSKKYQEIASKLLQEKKTR